MLLAFVVLVGLADILSRLLRRQLEAA
jgi:ABC-type phosphate/phosphonate transport system permease subunit